MKVLLQGAACALLPLAIAAPAAAQDIGQDTGRNIGQDTAQATGQDTPPIIVESPLLHPAAGLMGDHMHQGGEVMIGLRYERSRWSGTNQSGTEEIADADVLAAGYSSRTSSMVMDMLMLDLMAGVTDNLTLMAMPHYMWHDMEMVGIDPASGEGGAASGDHAGHGMAPGATHRHGAHGFGDTLLSASYRLLRSRGLGAHATLGLWVPTGAVDLRNADGTFVHYGMQPGGGTWDVEPSLTVRGRSGALGWGVQGAYRWRTEEANASGFAFGDRARATGWISSFVAPAVGATARLEYLREGPIEGHYDGAHSHSSPADLQGNYGGDTVSAALGLNWLLPLATADRPQLNVELGVPLYQDLNGIQPPQDWRLSLALSRTF